MAEHAHSGKKPALATIGAVIGLVIALMIGLRQCDKQEVQSKQQNAQSAGAIQQSSSTASLQLPSAPEPLPSPEWQAVTAPAAGTTEYEAKIRPGYTIFRNFTDGIRIRCKDLFGAIQDTCPNGGTAELYQALGPNPKKLLIRYEIEAVAKAQAEATAATEAETKEITLKE